MCVGKNHEKKDIFYQPPCLWRWQGALLSCATERIIANTYGIRCQHWQHTQLVGIQTNCLQILEIFVWFWPNKWNEGNIQLLPWKQCRNLLTSMEFLVSISWSPSLKPHKYVSPKILTRNSSLLTKLHFHPKNELSFCIQARRWIEIWVIINCTVN